MSDVSFTFDPRGFERGTQAAAKSFDKLNAVMSGFAKGFSHKMSTAVAFGMAKVDLAIGAAKKAWGWIKQGVPELTQVFGAAGEIFRRNFFFPIRQMLLPYLQKVLDWTRQHRAMFVQWGATAANVLRVIIQFGEHLFQLFKGIALTVRDIFEKFFGLRVGAFAQNFNLIIAKIGITGAFLGHILGSMQTGIERILRTALPPLLKLLKSVAGLAWNALTGFIKGLKDTPGLGKAFKGLADAIGRLGVALGASGTQNGIYRMFKWLGGKVGYAAIDVLDLVTTALDTISGLIRVLNGQKVNWKGIFGEAMNIPLVKGARNVGTTVSNNYERLLEKGLSKIPYIGPKLAMWARKDYQATMPKGQKWVQDAIITPRGEIVRTSPEDYLYATKNPQMLGGVNVQVNVTVTEGSARQAGVNIATGIQQTLREHLRNRMVGQGR